MITEIKTNKKTKIKFTVSILGIDGIPRANFVIGGGSYDINIPAEMVGDEVTVNIPPGIDRTGVTPVRLEIRIGNKVFVPVNDTISFGDDSSAEVTEVVIEHEIDENILRKAEAMRRIKEAVPELDAESTIEEVQEKFSSSPSEEVQDALKLVESKDDEDSDEESDEESEDEAEELDDASDEEIEAMLKGIDDDHILDTYKPDEYRNIDEEVDTQINEVLSRQGRLKMRAQFARTKNIRARRMKILLHRKSDNKTLVHRARRLAVKAMEMKLARKPLNQLSVAEKERIERVIAKRGAILQKMTVKLLPRVKQFEKDRLAVKESIENPIEEASYAGNIGVMELHKFHSNASPEQKAALKKIMDKRKEADSDKMKDDLAALAWKLVEKVTGVKLK